MTAVYRAIVNAVAGFDRQVLMTTIHKPNVEMHRPTKRKHYCPKTLTQITNHSKQRQVEENEERVQRYENKQWKAQAKMNNLRLKRDADQMVIRIQAWIRMQIHEHPINVHQKVGYYVKWKRNLLKINHLDQKAMNWCRYETVLVNILMQMTVKNYRHQFIRIVIVQTKKKLIIQLVTLKIIHSQQKRH